MVKKSIIVFLTLILLVPYLLLLSKVDPADLNVPELMDAFKNSLVQTVLSSFATLALGFWAGMGLMAAKNLRQKRLLELSCLIPSFLPPLFFVTALLQILKPFPFGIIGIVLVHVLTYIGLTAIFFQSLFQNKFLELSEMAYLEGASQTQFLIAVIKNIRIELFMMFLFLFVQFFTSFSVPLLVAHQELTIETLIYQKIVVSGALSDAMLISAMETLFIMIILIIYRTQRSLAHKERDERVFLLDSRSGIFLIVFPVFLFLLGAFKGTILGLKQMSLIEFSQIGAVIFKSITLSFFVGFVLFVILGLIAFIYRNRFFDRFLLSYIPLSTVLVGLSLILFDFHLGFIEKDMKFLLAMLILFLPTLYRYELKPKLAALEHQIEVARLMGASSTLIFKKIIFPQISPSILFLSGLGAFWAIGDFAISQIIYGDDVTLALYIQNVLGAYRLELANLLMIILLLLGLMVFVTFREMQNVFSQRN